MAAVASAFFAGITSILAKCGLSETDSDVATALRTLVVLVFAWIMVAVVGSGHTIAQITLRSWLFLALSGLATGGSWICYFKALSLGDVNKVVPVDKSSTVMAVLLAIVLFGETSHLEVKLVGTAVIAVGTFMMIEKKQGASGGQSCSWLVYALLAAVFAALTSVLAKVGIEGVESDLATAIRTCFVLIMAWVIVVGKGKLSQVRHIDVRELCFLVASGLAVLLLCDFCRSSKRCGADRQALHPCFHCLCLDCARGASYAEIGRRFGACCGGHTCYEHLDMIGKTGPVPILPLKRCSLQHAQKCLNMQQCPSLHEFADAGWGALL